jgi:urease accessory protein
MPRWVSLATAMALSASPALAHTGIGETTGFVHGFMHPIGGLDHVLAMVAVGLFAALLGGRALWRVPAWCTDQGWGRTDPNPVRGQATRT